MPQIESKSFNFSILYISSDARPLCRRVFVRSVGCLQPVSTSQSPRFPLCVNTMPTILRCNARVFFVRAPIHGPLFAHVQYDLLVCRGSRYCHTQQYFQYFLGGVRLKFSPWITPAMDPTATSSYRRTFDGRSHDLPPVAEKSL